MVINHLLNGIILQGEVLFSFHDEYTPESQHFEPSNLVRLGRCVSFSFQRYFQVPATTFGRPKTWFMREFFKKSLRGPEDLCFSTSFRRFWFLMGFEYPTPKILGDGLLVFGGAPNQRMGKKRPQLCRWFYFWSSLTIPILRPPKVSRWPLKPNSFPRNVWWTKPTPQLKQCHGARKNHSITTQN